MDISMDIHIHGSIRTSWSTVSKAAVKSKRIKAAKSPRSIASIIPESTFLSSDLVETQIAVLADNRRTT